MMQEIAFKNLPCALGRKNWNDVNIDSVDTYGKYN